MRGQGKEESGQEVTHFGGGDGKKELWGFSLLWGSIGREMTLVVHANTNKEGIGEQDKRHVTIPSDEASDLILVESEVGCRASRSSSMCHLAPMAETISCSVVAGGAKTR